MTSSTGQSGRRHPIPIRSSALVLNDMINAGLRRENDPAHNRLVAESRLIPNTVQLVAAVREKAIPVFWVRVERRPDRADVIDSLIDAPAYAWHSPNPPVVAGSYSAANVDELPIQPLDHVIIKPRLNPFTYTDLDLQLRARHVNTILLGGYSTNLGVESCARTGHDLGYDVVVISDCCFNVDKVLHEFAIARILPNFARVMTSEQAISLLR
jgi:nicotinamidase-related amidase